MHAQRSGAVPIDCRCDGGSVRIWAFGNRGVAPVGAAEGHVHDRVLLLTCLFVKASHRGRGVGSALLCSAARFCRASGVRRIELDDMTGRRSEANIYCKHGFRYDAGGGPEMHGRPRAVLAAAREKCHRVLPSRRSERLRFQREK